jgi:hypothetical protein
MSLKPVRHLSITAGIGGALGVALLACIGSGCRQASVAGAIDADRGRPGPTVLLQAGDAVLSLALEDGKPQQLWPRASLGPGHPEGIWIHDRKRDCYYALAERGASLLRLRPQAQTAEEVLHVPDEYGAFSGLLAITADGDGLLLFMEPSVIYRWEIDDGRIALVCDTGNLGRPDWVRSTGHGLYLGRMGAASYVRADGTAGPSPHGPRLGLYEARTDGAVVWTAGERVRDVSPSGQLVLEATPNGYAVSRLDGTALARQPKLEQINKQIVEDDRIARSTDGVVIDTVGGRRVTRKESGAEVPDQFRGEYMRTEPVFVSDHQLAYVREGAPYTLALTLPHYGLYVCDLETGKERRVFKGSTLLMARGSYGRAVPWHLFGELLGKGK